ncbi:MAG: acetylpolyamine aminohydrolase [Rhizobiales bacterium NRL2]|jgi:acetoin utilization deacetylase AcuC-like enzyme|nr:MAG: acetylpolyamine aminohydrolase [Rhizobiales bacterium NRL2]
MKVIYSSDQQEHAPRAFISSGRLLDSPERPERAERFLEAVRAAGHDIEAPGNFGRREIAAVHGVDYLEFLETAHERWSALPDASPEVVANVHPGRHMAHRPDHVVGQAGWHMADTACPIGAGTWKAARSAAHCALTGMRFLLENETPVYALCRPPGHHAFADMAGGFCFLNNAAIAAQQAVAAGRTVAILDIDVHHGNGTQGIFYGRRDVMFISVHAHPGDFYPFFSGYADERGRGEGEGYNLNLPLARGAGDEDYLAAVEKGLAAIRRYGADCVVVSLGLDAQENDPLGILSVTTEGFRRAGRLIGRAATPALIVQEGGYLCPELGANLAAFLSGYLDR